MFDVHYHLIFGVDDGPKTIEDSLALAEASIAEGVTHIVATPHANDRYSFDPDSNREKLALLSQRLDGRLTLALGCDFHMSYDNIVALHRDPSPYTINGKQYLLVEFAELVIPGSATELLLRIRSSGIVPIITHPERNQAIASDPRRLSEWIETGCLVQVTAGSLLGDFGRGAESMARELVRKNQVHLIASDAHSVEWRPPAMRKAYDLIRDDFGQATADRLCIDNSRRVFFGEALPFDPQPDARFHRGRSKRSLLSRLFHN